MNFLLVQYNMRCNLQYLSNNALITTYIWSNIRLSFRGTTQRFSPDLFKANLVRVHLK